MEIGQMNLAWGDIGTHRTAQNEREGHTEHLDSLHTHRLATGRTLFIFSCTESHGEGRPGPNCRAIKEPFKHIVHGEYLTGIVLDRPETSMTS